MSTSIEQLRALLGDTDRIIPFESNLMGGGEPNLCRYKVVQQKTQIKCIWQCRALGKWRTAYVFRIPRVPEGISFYASFLGEQMVAHLRSLQEV